LEYGLSLDESCGNGRTWTLGRESVRESKKFSARVIAVGEELNLGEGKQDLPFDRRRSTSWEKNKTGSLQGWGKSGDGDVKGLPATLRGGRNAPAREDFGNSTRGHQKVIHYFFGTTCTTDHVGKKREKGSGGGGGGKKKKGRVGWNGWTIGRKKD